ncbi:MAG: hypothetical protein KKC99_03505 [Proteobacteria bacterium]|nr:hypothetical protein [Pseudomonadota bacterium]
MGFLNVVGQFLAKEVMQRLGKDVLVEGRRVFAEELAKGLSQQEAARIAAKHMSAYAAKKGLRAAKSAGQKAGKAAVRGSEMLREHLRKQ